MLLVGGDGDTQIAPAGRGRDREGRDAGEGPEKIRIGKYKQRTGYKRHTGFRASLTQIEIESIGGAGKSAAKQAAKPKPAAPAKKRRRPRPAARHPAGLPEGYDDLTVAQVKEAAAGWDDAGLEAALDYEQAHGSARARSPRSKPRSRKDRC